MAEVRVFNPSSYTPRSYFAGGEERRSTKMAKHRRHHYHRRRNPLGISGSVVKDAAYNAGGALGSMYLASKFNLSGWMDVLGTAGAAVAVSFAGKYVGGPSASEELLKGGLTATIIKALHQSGFASSLGLGLYANSYFPTPTSSDQYLRSAFGNGQVLLPAAVASKGLSGSFRSRYAGRYA
jgi:hypothetical protein